MGIVETNEIRVELFCWKRSMNIGEIFIMITPAKYGVRKTKTEIIIVISSPRYVSVRFGMRQIRTVTSVVVLGLGAAKNRL